MTALSPISNDGPTDVAGNSRVRRLLLWAAFLVGFSPVFVDLLRHQFASPWARYSALFIVLLVWTAARSKAPPLPRRDGALWVAAGALVTLLAVGGGMPRLARPGVALAAVGLGRLLGSPPAAVLVLAAWAVPIPHNLLHLVSPGLESGLLRLGGLLVSPFGLDLTIDGALATGRAGTLALREGDCGLPLVALLSGLGYYAGLCAGRGALARLGRVFVWGMAAVPIQIAGVALALVLLAGGADQAASGLLTHALWMTAAAGGLFLAGRGATASSGQAPAESDFP